jgi:hypothetical protein
MVISRRKKEDKDKAKGPRGPEKWVRIRWCGGGGMEWCSEEMKDAGKCETEGYLVPPTVPHSPDHAISLLLRSILGNTLLIVYYYCMKSTRAMRTLDEPLL